MLVPRPPFPDHLRTGGQDAAVVHAGPQTQDRRHAHGFTDLPQPGTGQIGGLGPVEAGLGQGNLGASGLDHQDIVLDQFLDQFHMDPVLFDPGIGAAHHTGHAPDPSVDDVVVERPVGRPEGAAQHIVDVFMGKAVDADVLDLGNFNRAAFRFLNRSMAIVTMASVQPRGSCSSKAM